MIRQVSQILGTPILSHAEGEPLGLLGQPIIHPDTGKIEAFWVKPLTLPIKQGVLLVDDITEWKKYLYIRDERVIAEPNEVIRIAEILDRKEYIFGNRVKGESGKGYGRVLDADFDDRKMYLRYLHVRRSWLFLAGKTRFFHFDSIVQVLPECVLVKDDGEKAIRSVVPDEQAA
jgi:sporulation protein YlmC with PRC-barrel domain